MAGHSKWKNIQHRKGRQDAKRAKTFTKISKEIFAAVKSGGADPVTNQRLKMALDKAKAANMPHDNIERTIKKASGDLEGIEYEEIVYEGYGPYGIAIMVEVLTDNRNRSAADIRHIFNKNNGNLGETGCVAFMFERKGIIEINRQESDAEEDDLMLEAIEAGALDLQTHEDFYHIITEPSHIDNIQAALMEKGIPISSAEVTMMPQTTVMVKGEEAKKILRLVEALEDNDDVQSVYGNFDMDAAELENMEV